MTRSAKGSRRPPATGQNGSGFEARPWGSFRIIGEGAGYKVKRLVVEPGQRLSLQRHRFRAEHWIVVAGTPRVLVAGRAWRLRARGTVTVPRGAWHRIENPGRVPVVIIEVQHGQYLGEDDIIRCHDDYGRAGEGFSGRRPAGGRPSATHPKRPRTSATLSCRT